MTKTKKIIPPLTDLGCGLAIEFVQNVGKDKFTIFATLDHAHPKSITNNRILAAELERVYHEGEASGRRAALAAAPVQAQEPVAQIRTDVERASLVWFGKVPPHGTMLYTAPVQPVAVAVPDGNRVSVGRVLLSAACHAIETKKDAPTILTKLHAILSAPAAPAAQGDVNDTKLMDFLTSRASIVNDFGACVLRFEMPDVPDGDAANLRDIVRTAMESDDD